MKKIFLAGALTACLLLTNCADGLSAPIDFHANDVATVKTYSSGTDLDEVTEETAKATKESIDWSKAPHFKDFDSLIEYLNSCKKKICRRGSPWFATVLIPTPKKCWRFVSCGI